MPSFGESSRKKLDTCDPRLVQIMERVVEHYDIKILEGRRSWARQRELLEEGRTKVGPGESKHNPPTDGDQDWLSKAVDAAPYPIDWQDAKRFIYMAGMVMGIAAELGIKIRWGGIWDMDQVILDDQNFDDLPHFEIVDG